MKNITLLEVCQITAVIAVFILAIAGVIQSFFFSSWVLIPIMAVLLIGGLGAIFSLGHAYDEPETDSETVA